MLSISLCMIISVANESDLQEYQRTHYNLQKVKRETVISVKLRNFCS